MNTNLTLRILNDNSRKQNDQFIYYFHYRALDSCNSKNIMLYYVMPCYVMQYSPMLCHIVPCYSIECHALLCYVVLCNVMLYLYYSMKTNFLQCYAMSVMPCYAI